MIQIQYLHVEIYNTITWRLIRRLFLLQLFYFCNHRTISFEYLKKKHPKLNFFIWINRDWNPNFFYDTKTKFYNRISDRKKSYTKTNHQTHVRNLESVFAVVQCYFATGSLSRACETVCLCYVWSDRSRSSDLRRSMARIGQTMDPRWPWRFLNPELPAKKVFARWK